MIDSLILYDFPFVLLLQYFCAMYNYSFYIDMQIKLYRYNRDTLS